MQKGVKCCQVARLWLGLMLWVCGLSLALASAQLAAEAPLPDAPSASTLRVGDPGAEDESSRIELHGWKSQSRSLPGCFL